MGTQLGVLGKFWIHERSLEYVVMGESELIRPSLAL